MPPTLPHDKTPHSPTTQTTNSKGQTHEIVRQDPRSRSRRRWNRNRGRQQASAVATVVNKFNQTLKYQYRWGNGAWKMAYLPAGNKMRHSWRYQFAGQNKSPKFQILLDADFGPHIQCRYYTLKKYATQLRCSDGKRYTFKYTGNGYMIELVPLK